MNTVFNIRFGFFLLVICHFDVCFSDKHDKVKKALRKIIESGEKVNGEFSISKELLGDGMSSIVYKGKRLGGDEAEVAIKVEDCDPRDRDLFGIGEEHKIYSKLGACANEKSFNKKLTGIPIIYYYGKYHKTTYDVLVMTMINNTIRNECERLWGLSRETVFMIAIQAIERLEYIHGRGVIVQDVHPHNMGHINDVIYIFDLNMAKLKGSTKFSKSAIGAPACRSVSADKGKIEEKDDMIALGFSLCDLYGKQLKLPWVSKARKNPKSNMIKTMLEIKEQTVIKDWLESTNCTDASVFINYFKYLDDFNPGTFNKLRPANKIDYSYLKGLFITVLTGSPTGKVKYEFDWMKTQEI